MIIKNSEIAKRLKALEEIQFLKLSELLSPSFLAQYTRFSSVDELFEVGGFEFDKPEDVEHFHSEVLDAFIAEESAFASWQEMIGTAGAELMRRKLGVN